MKQLKITEYLFNINTNLLEKNIELLKEILKDVDLTNNEQIETIKYLLNTIQGLKTNHEKLTERLQILKEEEE